MRGKYEFKGLEEFYGWLDKNIKISKRRKATKVGQLAKMGHFNSYTGNFGAKITYSHSDYFLFQKLGKKYGLIKGPRYFLFPGKKKLFAFAKEFDRAKNKAKSRYGNSKR